MFCILQLKALHVQLGLPDEPFQHCPSFIMWIFPMAKAEEVPQIDATTSDMKIISHKVPWGLILEL